MNLALTASWIWITCLVPLVAVDLGNHVVSGIGTAVLVHADNDTEYGKVFGFSPLPLSFVLVMGGIVVSCIFAAEMTKKVSYNTSRSSKGLMR